MPGGLGETDAFDSMAASRMRNIGARRDSSLLGCVCFGSKPETAHDHFAVCGGDGRPGILDSDSSVLTSLSSIDSSRPSLQSIFQVRYAKEGTAIANRTCRQDLPCIHCCGCRGFEASLPWRKCIMSITCRAGFLGQRAF